LAAHLEVIAGDKAKANLGIDAQTWERLSDTVDLIVDPAALVNHVLPYSELFGPNVVGTAELIRLALTSRIKPTPMYQRAGWPIRSSLRRSSKTPTSGRSARAEN
jgi:fatty acid CoA ligase FadD9